MRPWFRRAARAALLTAGLARPAAGLPGWQARRGQRLAGRPGRIDLAALRGGLAVVAPPGAPDGTSPWAGAHHVSGAIAFGAGALVLTGRLPGMARRRLVRR